MPVEWSLEAVVPAPPDAVFAWMIDFREDDHARPAFLRGAGVPEKEWGKRASSRRVVSRDGDVVTLEDRWGRNRSTMRVTVDAARRELRLDGQWGYRATWRAEPAPGGATRLSSRGEIAPGGLFGLLAPLFARSVRRQMEQDFRGHVADAASELAGKAS